MPPTIPGNDDLSPELLTMLAHPGSSEHDLLHFLVENIPDSIYFKDTQSRFHASAGRLRNSSLRLGDVPHSILRGEGNAVRPVQERDRCAPRRRARGRAGERERGGGESERGLRLPLLAIGLDIFHATLRAMSTLAEIETAADSLSSEEKEELLRFLAMRLRKDRAMTQPRIYSDEELATMLAEDGADGERFRQGR